MRPTGIAKQDNFYIWRLKAYFKTLTLPQFEIPFQ